MGKSKKKDPKVLKMPFSGTDPSRGLFKTGSMRSRMSNCRVGDSVSRQGMSAPVSNGCFARPNLLTIRLWPFPPPYVQHMHVAIRPAKQIHQYRWGPAQNARQFVPAALAAEVKLMPE